MRLRPDAQTGLVREVWVQELKVNEQPLLPEQLTRWVELGAVAWSKCGLCSVLARLLLLIRARLAALGGSRHSRREAGPLGAQTLP